MTDTTEQSEQGSRLHFTEKISPRGSTPIWTIPNWTTPNWTIHIWTSHYAIIQFLFGLKSWFKGEMG